MSSVHDLIKITYKYGRVKNEEMISSEILYVSKNDFMKYDKETCEKIVSMYFSEYYKNRVFKGVIEIENLGNRFYL